MVYGPIRSGRADIFSSVVARHKDRLSGINRFPWPVAVGFARTWPFGAFSGACSQVLLHRGGDPRVRWFALSGDAEVAGEFTSGEPVKPAQKDAASAQACEQR